VHTHSIVHQTLTLRHGESAMCANRETGKILAFDQLNEVIAKSLDRLNLQDFWEEITIRVSGYKVNGPFQWDRI
jgi:hypothetical protein